MEEAAVARSLGDKGVFVSDDGVRPSADGGRRRRESREWRGGRISNNCGGGSVSVAGALVIAVGMIVTSDQGCSTCFAIGDCECRFVLIVGQESEKWLKGFGFPNSD